MVKSTVGEKISKLRASRCMTLEEIAELVGVVRQTVVKWESNKMPPKIESLRILSKFFDVSVDDIIDEDIDIFSEQYKIRRRIEEEIRSGVVSGGSYARSSNEDLKKKITPCNDDKSYGLTISKELIADQERRSKWDKQKKRELIAIFFVPIINILCFIIIDVYNELISIMHKAEFTWSVTFIDIDKHTILYFLSFHFALMCVVLSAVFFISCVIDGPESNCKL